MAKRSKIEWTDATWNVATGCTKTSSGCTFCYAKRTTERFNLQDFTQVQLHPERLKLPLQWRKPKKIFVCSMGDLFHKEVPLDFIQTVFGVMAQAQQHIFQVLTKQPERMLDILTALSPFDVTEAYAKLIGSPAKPVEKWPLPNVWTGISAENQKWLEKRVHYLTRTPATVRFPSLEPLLGPINLNPIYDVTAMPGREEPMRRNYLAHLHWVIVGGESGGPPERALVEKCCCLPGRPVDERGTCLLCYGTGWRPKSEALEWVRSIRDQCVAAEVPFFFKQWGGPTPKSGGRLLDRRKWDQFPDENKRNEHADDRHQKADPRGRPG